jgi:hypothetical protein
MVLSSQMLRVSPATRASFLSPNNSHRYEVYVQRMVSTDGGNPASKPSSAILQNLAMFAVAGTIGYGAVTLFNGSGNAGYDTDGPVSPSAPITSRVYFDVSIQNQPTGRIIMGLYGSTTPKTVKNFETLCRGTSSLNGRQLW